MMILLFLDAAMLDMRCGHADSGTQYYRVFMAARQQLGCP
jgi:hypothetical protein